LTYNLPGVTDPEEDMCTISMVGTSSLATFSSPNIVNINPGNPGMITPSTYTIALMISDGINNPTFTLSIIVIDNSPPVFQPVPEKQYAYPGIIFTYKLPEAYDINSDPITISMNAGGPPFITYSTGIITVASSIS
jgi:hypothetical protein